MKTAAMMGTTFPQEPGGSMENTMVQLEGQPNAKNAFKTWFLKTTTISLLKKLQMDAGSGGSYGQKFTFLYE